MSGFYFFSLPQIKIRRGWVVDDILLPPPVSIAPSVPGVAFPSAPETMVSSSSFIPLASEVTSRVPSFLFPVGPVTSSKNLRQSDKRKAVAHSKEEMFMPGKGMETWRILGRSGEAGRILLQRLRITFSKIENHFILPFLFLLVSMNTSTLDPGKTS
ncbi:hypothetical protein Fot_21292 [Forsythia ovata]|uniref:Uncharacterized protein n=1 Tax=Forsythia ovata TaxID=205694 RepID=A0ABD1UUF3_9LAMI